MGRTTGDEAIPVLISARIRDDTPASQLAEQHVSGANQFTCQSESRTNHHRSDRRFDIVIWQPVGIKIARQAVKKECASKVPGTKVAAICEKDI